jgi:hypothetical protein
MIVVSRATGGISDEITVVHTPRKGQDPVAHQVRRNNNAFPEES